MFCFSILVSIGPHKFSLVWYTSKHGVEHNPPLHSRHFNFALVSLFLTAHTWHRIPLHCISQWLLCLWQTRFVGSWMGLGFLVLRSQSLSGEGSLLMWGASFCNNPLEPPVSLWTTGTISRHFVLSVRCVKFVSLTPSVSLSVSLSLWA